MAPEPLDYCARKEDVAPASSPLPLNPGGLISLGCCFLWIGCVVVAAVVDHYISDTRHPPEWVGTGPLTLAICLGAMLLPLGGLVGLLSAFTHYDERATPLLGLVLNGLAGITLMLLGLTH